MKSGYVAVGGRPNVGKSTLFNSLLGPKLSIVSRRRQTTRYSIRGVLTQPDAQFVFIDTPGWQRRDKGSLNRILNSTAEHTLPHADVGLLVLEGKALKPDDERVAGFFPEHVPVVAVLNKIDLVKRRETMLPLVDELNSWRNFAAVVPISAQTGEGIDSVKNEVRNLLPETDPLYPADTLSDRNDSFFLADFIRERIYCLLGDELPYRSAVEIRAIKKRRNGTRCVHADIIVDSNSRKAMFIGAKGQMLKKIGSSARPLLEEYLGAKIHLDLFIRVQRDWMDKPAELARLGLGK